MTDWLAGPRIRTDRAAEHLDSLGDEIAASDKAEPLSLTTDKEPETGWKIVRLSVINEPPMRLGLLAGEICYQLRAALNNLVGDLLRASSVKPTREHQFPINPDPGQWTPENVHKWLGGLRDEWIAIILEYQPHRADESLRSGHPLRGLATLANLDKHSTIPPSRVLMGQHDIEIVPTMPGSVDRVEIRWANDLAALHNGTELCRILTFPDPNSTVNVKWSARLPIGFGGPVPATIVDLERLIELVRSIINRFD